MVFAFCDGCHLDLVQVRISDHTQRTSPATTQKVKAVPDDRSSQLSRAMLALTTTASSAFSSRLITRASASEVRRFSQFLLWHT